MSVIVIKVGLSSVYSNVPNHSGACYAPVLPAVCLLARPCPRWMAHAAQQQGVLPHRTPAVQSLYIYTRCIQSLYTVCSQLRKKLSRNLQLFYRNCRRDEAAIKAFSICDTIGMLGEALQHLPLCLGAEVM